MRFFEYANYNFIQNRIYGYVFSGCLILIALGAILFRGLQYGVDFRGGTELVISFSEPVSVNETQQVLAAALGTEPQVRVYGSASDLQIRTDAEIEVEQLTNAVTKALATAYPGNDIEVEKTDLIGPVFAEDIRDAALNATIFSVLVIGVYIFLRFKELTFMLSVVSTLVHDTLIIVGTITLLNGIMPFDLDINQNLIAALLTIIGYSLNDTIVVFDRIRENRMVHKAMDYPKLVNMSINQTMSRTVVTSLTTLFVVFVLFLFGGGGLKSFSFTLLIGIVLGTYSTIFFACPMVVDLPVFKQLKPRAKKTSVRRARLH